MLGAVVGLRVLALTGCGADTLAPQATVYFVLDAPFCSLQLPVQFWIDGTPVGADAFRVRLPPNDTTSAGFRTAPGTHSLGARVVGGLVWPDTTVTLSPGEVFTRLLPFYCS